MKTCCKCKTPKPSTEFHKLKKSADGLQGKCKSCSREDQQAYYQKNKERLRKEAREKVAGYGPAYQMFAHARERARAQGLPFNLEVSDVVIPAECPLLNIPLTKGKGRSTRNSPTLDKVVPSLGYVKGNVRVISKMANAMKQDATEQELQTFFNNLKTYLNGK